MSRVRPVSHEQAAAIFGPDAPVRQRVYAQAPLMAAAYREFARALEASTTVDGRVVELVRLRIAFHNQCRSCMSLRYCVDGAEGGLDQETVCSLEQPYEAPNITRAERAALSYADRMATDHLSVDDALLDELHLHFTEQEVVELCFRVAVFIGFGRTIAALDLVDDLPDEYLTTGSLAPWSVPPAQLI
ncbi:carboxymuconolactone decarboxylase family protein [Nocardioides sediminis]|uniref:carboxymuconolactone decarboxylase family protein n=1 Tax=Nocardioides sediminis TaxID=433648 RepID=UPI000D319627|nr:carboxymuconolactone decarboxylase family protein [Nocardioides sediminis]